MPHTCSNVSFKSLKTKSQFITPCRVYLIPAGLCGWAGLAYTGCDGSFECRAWIEGNFWVRQLAIAARDTTAAATSPSLLLPV